MAQVYLPASLVVLFPGAPRRLELQAASVAELIEGLNERWPGMRDRLCAPGPSIREHINIFVDQERSHPATPLKPDSVVRVIPAVSGGETTVGVRTMLAVVYPEPGRYELKEVPVPEPDPHQVLVKVMATTICATDFKVFGGQFPGTRFPHTPGHEFAGEVVASGDGVPELRSGDRVGVEVHVGCGACKRCLEGLYTLCEHYGQVERGHAHIGFTVPGGLAQYAVVPAQAVHQLPENLSWDEGAFTDNVGVALWAIERSGLQAGERVAVVGPGAFGALAVQIASALGAGRVALVGTRPERMDLIRGLGVVQDFIDSSAVDPAAELSERWGSGADVVIEFAGSESAAQQAIQLARRGGRVVLAGATGPGRELKNVDLSTIVRGQLDIYGSLANPKGVSARGLALMARGAVDVKPLITHHFPLSQFPKAWDTFRERRGGAIRVMLEPWESGNAKE